ncbi:MAG: hypothetical protein K2X80_00560 [Pseudomonadaceae bacterium]|nr:hypothetical protein [Pseudomonadaceae bacterium]
MRTKEREHPQSSSRDCPGDVAVSRLQPAQPAQQSGNPSLKQGKPHAP